MTEDRKDEINRLAHSVQEETPDVDADELTEILVGIFGIPRHEVEEVIGWMR